MFIEKYTGKELIDFLYNNGESVLPVACGVQHFEGWTYFDGYNIHPCHEFLIAFNGVANNHMISPTAIIGVMKYGLYSQGTKDEHYGINYIDVHDSFKHQGIAKQLLSYFNNMNLTESNISCSSFSSFAKQIGFNKTVETSLKNYNVIYDYEYIVKHGQQREYLV